MNTMKKLIYILLGAGLCTSCNFLEPKLIWLFAAQNLFSGIEHQS